MPPIVHLKRLKHKRPIVFRCYLYQIIPIFVTPIVATHPALIIFKNFAPILVKVSLLISAECVRAIALKRNNNLTRLAINEQRPLTTAQARITTRPLRIILSHC